MSWRSLGSAPPHERPFIIQLDAAAGVEEYVTVVRFSRRHGVFLDVLNQIVLAPDDERIIGWQPLPEHCPSARPSFSLPPINRRGKAAVLIGLAAAAIVGGVGYLSSFSLIDAIFTMSAVFVLLAIVGLVYQRIRYGAFS
ncbi:hypothetical protein [Brucella endophytica]|uniref:hypothetical protein n=1 Tax=Brucella endophytica TaxID=1963359 RepID=UPI0016634740|nr:hypothetical protein [Brucella endophytica]